MPPKRAKTAKESAPDKPAPRTRATRSRVSAQDAIAATAAEGDESSSLIRSSSKKTRARTSSGKDDITMSGGLGEDRSKTTHQTRTSSSNDGSNAPERPHEPETPPRPLPRGRTRPPRTVKKTIQSEANKAAIEGLKKRMAEDAKRLKEGHAPAAEQGDVHTTASDDVERNIAAAAEVPAAPALPPTNISPSDHTRAAPSTIQRKAPSTIQRAPNTVQKAASGVPAVPGSSLKVQSTPGAENSILALANFRRRPRQPSLLQMVQNPELFQQDADESTAFTLGASDDEDDFAPYDESTPLQTSKTLLQQQSARSDRSSEPIAGTPQLHAAESERGADDDLDSLYAATPRPSPKPTRKRKSDSLENPEEPQSEIQVPRSQESPSPRRSRYSSPDLDQIVPATAPSSDSPLSSPQASQNSSIYADPISSSPPASPQSPTVLDRPSTTSPGAIRRSRGKESKPKPLTTATLRALLPKRRVRRTEERSDFDIPTSSSVEEDLNSDDDDLAARRRKRAASNRNGVLSPVARRVLQGKKGATITTVAAQAKGKKTYSRAITVSSSSDKENAASSSSLSELESEGTATPPDTSVETIRDTSAARSGKTPATASELKERKKFFEEVDQWEMEFESAPSLGGGMNSSPAWR